MERRLLSPKGEEAEEVIVAFTLGEVVSIEGEGKTGLEGFPVGGEWGSLKLCKGRVFVSPENLLCTHDL